MSLELFISIILSIPLAIIANIFTPKVQDWLNSRYKKSVEKQQDEELNTLKEEKEKGSQKEIEVIKDRLI